MDTREAQGLPPDDEPLLETEADRVEAWRLHVLLRASYPLELAERLASSSADLHEAVELLARGCPADLAAQILL